MSLETAPACVQAISRASFLTRIAPLGLCSAGTLSLGNMAYQHLDVAILEMLKACCPVFVLLAAIALRLERFTWARFLSTCVLPVHTLPFTSMTSNALPRQKFK